MKSKKELSLDYQKKFEDYLRSNTLASLADPIKFKELLKTNKGIINFFEINNEDYVELRNPLVVVLGDSVTGGYFETIDLKKGIFAQDQADGYVEKFKHMLHDKYANVVLNVINSGIAGDNVKGMYKRLQRDVINYDPHLVIINATLNWSKNRGSLDDYRYYLEKIIMDVLSKTNAEVIMMTPNGAITTESDQNIDERAEVVRELARKHNTTLVDVYKMWKDVVGDDDVRKTLSNDENHPTPLGHTYMAKALMQVFEKDYK